MPRDRPVHVRLTETEVNVIDAMRGEKTRAEFMREAVLYYANRTCARCAGTGFEPTAARSKL